MDVLSRFDSWSSLHCLRVCEFMTATLIVAQRWGPGGCTCPPGVCVNAKRPVMPGSSMRTGPMRHSSSLPDACYVRLFLPMAPARESGDAYVEDFVLAKNKQLICNKFIKNLHACPLAFRFLVVASLLVSL